MPAVEERVSTRRLVLLEAAVLAAAEQEQSAVERLQAAYQIQAAVVADLEAQTSVPLLAVLAVLVL
jgi:hypothetical protein